MASYKKLLMTIAVFTMGLSSTVSGFAFADDQNGLYSHSHETALWDHSLICGDHKCAPGELSGNPQPVVPVREH
jgi:hypothetical protein